MNTLIIGGTSGLGKRIAREIPRMSPHHAAERICCTGRDIDLTADGWVVTLSDKLTESFGDPLRVNTVILAAYDRNHHVENVQLNVANVLYSIFRKKSTQLVLIGDIEHQYTPVKNTYTAHKRALWRTAMEWGRDPDRVCPLLLYEPKTTGYEAALDVASHIGNMTDGEFFCFSAISPPIKLRTEE